MEPLKKRDQFLSCVVLNQSGIDHPDASFDDQEKASNVIEAEENALDLSIRHNGDETKVTEHEAGDASVNDGKHVNESKKLIIEGDANGVAFMAVIGDGVQPDETKVIEHAGGGGGGGGSAYDTVGGGEHTDDPMEVTGIAGDGGAPDNVGDGGHTDKPKEVIGNAGGDAIGGAIGDGEQTHKPIEVIELNTGGDAADAVGDGEHTDKPEEVIQRAGGGAPDAVDDGEQTDRNKKVIENNEQEQVVEMEDVTLIIDGGSSGNALDIIDDGNQMHVVDGACNVGGGDLTLQTGQGAQTEGKQQAAFLVPDGNDTAVAPGGGTPPMDDDIQNEQTHTYCTKRKGQEPGDSGHDAPRPKRTKHVDAVGDEIGTRSSSITPPVAGNRTLRLFGVNISADVQENPVMDQPRRTLRLFGVDISSPKDQE